MEKFSYAISWITIKICAQCWNCTYFDEEPWSQRRFLRDSFVLDNNNHKARDNDYQEKSQGDPKPHQWDSNLLWLADRAYCWRTMKKNNM